MNWTIQGSDSERTLLHATIATLAGAEPLNRASSRRSPGHTVIALPGEPQCTTRLVLKPWDLGGERLAHLCTDAADAADAAAE